MFERINFVKCTEKEYNNLTNKDPNTFYQVIKEDNNGNEDNNNTAASYILKDKEIWARTYKDKDFNAPFSDDTTGKIFLAEDDDGETYYYAGNPIDNYIKFGRDIKTNLPIWWRIIRINGNGSIRMIYQGTGTSSPAIIGEKTQIGTSKFNDNNNDNMYVGYFYEQNNVHGLETASIIYGVINNWYANNTNLLSLQSNYIDTNAGFCNDREPSTTNTLTVNNEINVGDGNGGTGTIETYYGAYLRLRPGGSVPSTYSTAVTPTFSCTDNNDLYTYSGANQGNKKLANPVGLITADEVAYAGMVYLADNTSNYLYTNQTYWTMSPNHYSNLWIFPASIIMVHSDGCFINGNTDNMYGVRPVINLRSDIKLTGDGTVESPYEVLD